jgi:CheY-like chemotaxis protein
MEAVGRLAGGIAHDFNNLLTVIGGRIEIALDNPTLPAGLRRDLEVVYRTAETAALLTRQLLAFGRKQMLQARRIDLNTVLGGLLPMLQRLIGEDVEVEFRRPPAAAWVEADPGQIEQVILNLAVNARDAMPQGGRLTLGASTVDRVDGSYVMLTVSDTGIGMDEATRARIFEPFFTTKPVGKGTGMGLATVFGIVKQSDGDILVASEPGRGTRFEIYLPRVDAPVAPDPKARPALVAEGTETVLVVEDEPEVRSLAREALERQGYVVLEAARPSEALRIAEEHAGPIPLLVTDVVMPEMKGPQLAERLRPRHPEMRVLYMSGYADLPEGTLIGNAPFLQKPFTTSALVQKVREILDSGRDR